MKKRFLLAVLPALMVLSSCKAFSADAAVKADFQEDTLAHDEVFGSVKLEENLPAVQQGKQPLRASNPEFDPNPDVSPFIGVQSFVDGGKVSFRFVAAVRFESDAAREQTDAVWHRSVVSSTGAFVKEEGVDAVPACTTAYVALNNNGVRYSIVNFNEDHGNSNYTHFVVYTLRNVNLTTYANHYVSAYLSLSKNGDSGINPTTKAIAINVERTEKYVYTHDLGAYFIVSNSFTQEADSVRTASGTDEDLAVFNEVDLSKGDTFVIKEFYNTKLFVHGGSGEQSCLKGNNNPALNYFENDNGLIKNKPDGDFKYKFYLNHSGELWIEAKQCVRTVYLKVSDASWWGNDGYKTALNAFGGSAAQAWLELVDLGNGYLKTKNAIDSNEYKKFIIARVPGSSFNNMGAGNNFNGVTDQTGDQELGTSHYNCLSIRKPGDTLECYWEMYSPAV